MTSRLYVSLILKNAVHYYEKLESTRKERLENFDASPIWRVFHILHLPVFASFSAFASPSPEDLRHSQSTAESKLILLDSDGIGPVAHYIHLNPVRAGLVEAKCLETYQASSFNQLWYPSKRWSFMDFECSLESEASEMRESRWGRNLEHGLSALGRHADELETSKKSERWKVALARYLRERLLVPNTWLAERLHMGTPNSVSSCVSRYRKDPENSDDEWNVLKVLEGVD